MTKLEKIIYPVKSRGTGILLKAKLFNGVHPVESREAGISPLAKLFHGVKKLIDLKPQNIEELFNYKRKLSSEFKIHLLPNVEILKIYRQLLKNKKVKRNTLLENILRRRAIRSLSGVSVIAVLTKPYSCPGKCSYCPEEKEMPKSYLSNEPAVMRAILCDFDPYKQVKTRLNALKITGHPTNKIELIIMGGTWSYLPSKYQTWFVKRCFDALNKKISKELSRAQKINEKSSHQCISLTLETRPDYINEEEIKKMREFGCTKVEIGVQTLDNFILQLNKRGHNVEDTIKATKLLKNAGFKVCYHMMPNLPGSNLKKDLQIFKKLFSDQNFKPDYLKIYPCVVVKNSPLYKSYIKGEYKPYSDKKLLELLIKIKTIIPPYVRIIRLVRDIPSISIEGGNKISNLRELLQKEMEQRGIKCKCIRCREIRSQLYELKNIKLIKRVYDSSFGKEYFISYEDIKNDKIIAFLRLRITKNTFPKELEGAAIIREIHTYGQQVPINEKLKSASQHFGFGKKLMREAEKICKKEKIEKIAVISGIGAREYYRKLGYKLEGTYMVKLL